VREKKKNRTAGHFPDQEADHDIGREKKERRGGRLGEGGEKRGAQHESGEGETVELKKTVSSVIGDQGNLRF